MKKFQVTILVDPDILQAAYIEGHDVNPEDCPPIEDMVQSELMWVLQSGIDLIGDIEPLLEDNEVES